MALTHSIKTLPSFLAVTEEQIRVSNEIQARARQAMYGRVQASQEEARLIRGISTERAVRAQLETLRVHSPHHGRADRVREQLGRLAEALADQGRYAEAAKTHPLKRRQKEFKAIQKAIDKDDGASCGCPEFKDVKDPLSNATLRIPQVNKVEDVYSPKHKRMMPLVRCVCGDLNVKALPQVLARRETMSASAPLVRVRDTEALK